MRIRERQRQINDRGVVAYEVKVLHVRACADVVRRAVLRVNAE